MQREFSLIRVQSPGLFWTYFFSSFIYSLIGAAMLLSFELPAVFRDSAPLPYEAYAALLVVQGLLSFAADVWARALRGFPRHGWYLADRVLATTMTVYTFALGLVFWGAHSSPTQRAIAAASLGGLVPIVLSQHSLRRGRFRTFMAWHVAWHVSIPSVAAVWLGHTCNGWFDQTGATAL